MTRFGTNRCIWGPSSDRALLGPHYIKGDSLINVECKTCVYMRWMIRRDIPEVVQIENKSSDNPWSKEDFEKKLRNRYIIGIIAEHNELIVGFIIYEL